MAVQYTLVGNGSTFSYLQTINTERDVEVKLPEEVWILRNTIAAKVSL
jgi:hypothetical protein